MGEHNLLQNMLEFNEKSRPRKEGDKEKKKYL